MRTLDLSVEDVGPGRTRAVLAFLESMMLFPDDPEKQRRTAYSGAAESYLQAPAPFADIDMQRWLRAAPHIEPLSAEIRRRFVIGLNVGRVVVELLCVKEKTLKGSMKEAEHRFNAIRDENLPIQHLQQNWWAKFRFRSVSHLWAASFSLDAWTTRRVFPCAVRDLPEFLAVAEYFRFCAERRPLSRQGTEMLLKSGEAYGLPPTIAPPIPPIVILPGIGLRQRSCQR